MASPTAAVLPWVVPVIVVLLVYGIQRRRHYARLPPGPFPLPILGNIFDFPRKHLGREFAALSSKFGDIVYLNLLGQDAIFLGSLKAARDLLDKRSANYSNRPESIMVQLVEFGWFTALMNYGPRWRQHRCAIHLTMGPEVVPQYEGIQSDAARNFLRDLLRDPQDLASHIKFTVTATTMRAIYGIEVPRKKDDKYYQMLERMAEVAEAILLPGKFHVEALPVLRYLPAWFPGGGFKTWAADAKRDLAYILDYLFSGAKAVMGDSSRRSVVSRILEDSESQEEQMVELEKMCKEVAATLYAGVADTLKVQLEGFFMAMTLYPEAQSKAQEELDAVVGTERLPEFSDRPTLPYLSALVKELLRWHPVAPLGLPHRVVADDEYKGYLIPGGATVFVNVWAILCDPEVYPQPHDFVPERFLDSAGNLDVHGRDPADVVFGFGRRVCPGRHFAESTMFILCASVLSAFEIGPPVGEDGAAIEVKWEATDHLVVSHPKVHKYSIKPRSSHVGQLVETAAAH
ncbi:cytochrome P450 [Ganoderma sinense ZZ0214-1]|uniref:Cytochrome P450 n=1 Tax=Ganoderma sinense ZZ0214-1 TaxID=1077348 RepID=A0A2G8S6Q0_9APHY|nr:cytochrome P450 [Ganoderma sinense ZZ0214-1]